MSEFQPYYDIMAFADERLKSATNQQISACTSLTMEDHDDIIASKIRNELSRRREAQAAGKHNKSDGLA